MSAALWRTAPSTSSPVPDLVFCAPERRAHGVARVRTYVRFSTGGTVVSPPWSTSPRAPGGVGRPGPAHHAGGRADPAGAPTIGPSLPRRHIAPRGDRHGVGTTGSRCHHLGAGDPGGGVGGRELVCRGRVARSRGGGRRGARARPAPGRLRSPPRW